MHAIAVQNPAKFDRKRLSIHKQNLCKKSKASSLQRIQRKFSQNLEVIIAKRMPTKRIEKFVYFLPAL
jgi:ribosomal protein L44E